MPSMLLDSAIAAVRAGGEVLISHFGSHDLGAVAKGANDFVTRADHDSEAVMVAEICRRHPDHRVLAEEGGGQAEGGDHQWLIDPLDGTSNFMQGLRFFCVSAAVRHGDALVAGAVYDPLGGELFTAAKGEGAFRNGEPIRVSGHRGLAGAFLATGYPYRSHAALDVYLAAFREVFLQARGVRRCGAAALDLAYTAAGIFDGFFEYALAPWDLAAGALLVTEAGGRITDLDGGDGFLEGGNVIAGSPAVHGELRSAVARHGSEAEVRRLTRGVEVAAAPAGGGGP